LKEYEDVFGEFSKLPPKRDIDFSIDSMLGVFLVSKTPYKMRYIDAARIIVEERGTYAQVSHLGVP
jgi:hypothetical protein